MPPAAYLQMVAATNFKQRTRMMMEYYHADRLQFAVAGTPNLLEYDQGFFVKQGDGAADFKPIAHLYKTQVFALAEYLGVADEIRARPPTTDTFSLSQTQEEFYFALPYAEMDLCLWAATTASPQARSGRRSASPSSRSNASSATSRRSDGRAAISTTCHADEQVLVVCGIAGSVASGTRCRLRRSRTWSPWSGPLRHRGPDEFGLYRDQRAALGHARLSIIDLATGQQPLSNEDGSIWVVFNGEIYNYVELRADLAALGHQFRTQSDTEVIVHAYEQWGDDAFARFNGQFAVALWNAAEERLVLARDRWASGRSTSASTPADFGSQAR